MKKIFVKINWRLWLMRLGLFGLPLITFAKDPLQIVGDVTAVLQQVVALLFVVATAYFAWGVITYLIAAGDTSKLQAAKDHMTWGIIGMATMAGVWGIAYWLLNYFGIAGRAIPTGPGF